MQITPLSGNLIKKRLTDTKDDKNDGAFNILEEDNLRKVDIAIQEIVSLTGFYGRPHPLSKSQGSQPIKRDLNLRT